MIVLFFSIVILFLYWFFAKVIYTDKIKAKCFFLLLSALHLLFLYMFRDESLFRDLYSYRDYFWEISESLGAIAKERDGDRFEMGWYVLNKIIKLFFSDYRTVFFFSYLVILYSYFKSFFKYSTFEYLSVFLFFTTCFYDSIFVLRQWMAMGICLLTIPYILQRNLKKFLLFSLIALSFHYSALVWLPIYFVYKIRINLKFVFYLFLFLFVIMASISVLMHILMAFFPALEAYTFGETGGELQSLKPTMISLLVILFAFYFYRSFDSFKEENKLFLMMLFIALVMNLAGAIGTEFTLFSRLTIYYSQAALLLLPNTFGLIKDQKIKAVSFATISLLYVILFNNSAQYGFRLVF